MLKPKGHSLKQELTRTSPTGKILKLSIEILIAKTAGKDFLHRKKKKFSFDPIKRIHLFSEGTLF